MLKMLPICFFLFSAFVNALTLDERRVKIENIVNEELAEVTRLAEQQDNKKPETLLRISELYLEKARLWRESENDTYLAIPLEQRKNVSKKSYFKKSSLFFKKANNSAEKVVKKFPNYSEIGEIYFILAYNYKELGQLKISQEYFRKASKYSKNTKTHQKSKLALAEFYYNEKKYAEAIPLYESSLDSENKWWTKDAFNLAWCYYRVKNYDAAINLLKNIHQKSGGKYIDLRSQVERDIGIFYVDAKKIPQAISFYTQLGINYTDQFIRISNSIVSQGRFEQAEELLEQVKKIETSQDKKIQLLLAQLNLFDKFNKDSSHLQIAQDLTSIHLKQSLDKSSFERLNFQVAKKAAELQKQVASPLYQNHPEIKNQKSKLAISYFDLSLQLNPGARAEKTFYKGETAYSAKKFSKALNYYLSSFDQAKIEKNNKISSQSIEGLLSCLENMPSKESEKYYIPTYSRYLEIDSKSERAKTIFVKLFNTQFDAGKIDDAESTMRKFSAQFSRDILTQEGMLAKIMEHHRKNKNYPKVLSLSQDISQGVFKVTPKYALAIKSLLTKIQIEGVQSSLAKGDKALATQGYVQIFNSSESTPKAKANAAYNLAILYFEASQIGESYNWSMKALEMMEKSDIVKFSDSLLNISAGMFLKQEFKKSSDLSFHLLKKICDQRSNNKTVAFKNASFIALANKDVDLVFEYLNQARLCELPDSVVSEVQLEILKDLSQNRRWDKMELVLSSLEKNPLIWPQLIKPLEELRLEHMRMGNTEDEKGINEKQMKFFHASVKNKVEIPVEALDLIAHKQMVLLKDLRQRINSIPLEFPENLFNNNLKSKLQLLDQMSNELSKFQKLGSGKGIVESYAIAIDSNETVGIELKAFSPKDKPVEYVESFKKAMEEVYRPILQNANRLRQDVKKLVYDNQILSDENFNAFFPKEHKSIRFYPPRSSVIMDRGGLK